MKNISEFWTGRKGTIRLGGNERAIQAGLNIRVKTVAIQNPIYPMVQEALLDMDIDETEIFVDFVLRKAGIVCDKKFFYMPAEVWHKERKNEEA